MKNFFATIGTNQNFLATIGTNLVALAAVFAAFYLCLHDNQYWGWFLVLAFASTASNFKN